MKKKLIIGGFLTLISVMGVVAYLIFQGIFIPNQLKADKFLIKGVDVASYQGEIDWRELEKQSMKFGNMKVETFYPGKGHTEDNIVVWLPQYNILAGGCLVKSTEAKDLGNVADAYVNEWSGSIENVLNRYGNMISVVPGHGHVGDKGLLLHTLDLLK
ncbi:hypothetical protein [Bacillus paramycoides]|uniref:hypothetical protein n=1 Tax=Bacillus paramycoides TaxID=2026194 RepID=UPI002E1C1D39|nr:hypothetical protein [Bacillus paramycoides]